MYYMCVQRSLKKVFFYIKKTNLVVFFVFIGFRCLIALECSHICNTLLIIDAVFVLHKFVLLHDLYQQCTTVPPALCGVTSEK